MALNVVNRYSAPISVMVEYYHPACQDAGLSPWRKVGWYNIPPNSQKAVILGNLAGLNRYWYFYAQATDGMRWQGPFRELVRSSAFQECADLADNVHYRWIGMTELDVDGGADYFLVLTA